MARTVDRPRAGLPESATVVPSQRASARPPPTPTTRVLRSQARTLTQMMPPRQAGFKVGKGAKTTKRRKRLDPWYPKRKSSGNPKPRPPPETHFTCRICISHLPSAEFVRWKPPRRARYSKDLDAPFQCIPHLARNPSRRHIDPVCKTCVGASMAARLDTLGARSVSGGCLEPGCATDWPWEMVIKYFPAEKLEEYNIAAFDMWRLDSDLFTCLSPTCSASGLLDANAPGYPQVSCSACAFRSCATCATPWHTQQTCAEVSAAAINAQMSDPEKQTLELMQTKDGKRCPNCQLVIEKDGGCPSMFCPCCKKYFNWETAASAVPGTKKALPVQNGVGYWQTPGNVVCEVDRLEGKVPDAVVGIRTEEVEWNNDVLEQFDFDPFLGMGVNAFEFAPMPDEDDADL